MLGRLPARYRLAIWVVGLLTSAGAGVWLAVVTDLASVWSSAAIVGAGLGVLIVAGYLNVLEKDPGRRPAARGR